MKHSCICRSNRQQRSRTPTQAAALKAAALRYIDGQHEEGFAVSAARLLPFANAACEADPEGLGHAFVHNAQSNFSQFATTHLRPNTSAVKLHSRQGGWVFWGKGKPMPLKCLQTGDINDGAAALTNAMVPAQVKQQPATPESRGKPPLQKFALEDHPLLAADMHFNAPLILFGQKGGGKSRMAAWILRYLMRDHTPALRRFLVISGNAETRPDLERQFGKDNVIFVLRPEDFPHALFENLLEHQGVLMARHKEEKAVNPDAEPPLMCLYMADAESILKKLKRCPAKAEW